MKTSRLLSVWQEWRVMWQFWDAWTLFQCQSKDVPFRLALLGDYECVYYQISNISIFISTILISGKSELTERVTRISEITLKQY